MTAPIEFKIAMSTYTPLDVFEPGVSYCRQGFPNGTAVFARSTGRQWAPTCNRETFRDGNGAPISFETAEQALRYAIDQINADTVECEINVSAYGDEPTWQRGMRGPRLGLCPTLNSHVAMAWTPTAWTRPQRVATGGSRLREASAA